MQRPSDFLAGLVALVMPVGLLLVIGTGFLLVGGLVRAFHWLFG